MAYERFSLGRNRNLFGEDEPIDDLVQRGPAPLPEPIGTHPLDAPLQRQDLVMKQPSPLGLGQNPFGQMQRPTFDPSSVQIGGPAGVPETPAAKPNILDEYNRIAGERPERAALKELMGNAPRREDYKPNKLTRLGAILGGVSAGFRDPGKGMELAQSTLDRPYNEASAEYDKKLRNVAGLAGMESEDVRTRLEGLKLGEDVRRSDRSYERGALESDRTFQQHVLEFGAEQAYRASALRQQGWKTYTDETTGMLMATNPETGEKKTLGRAAQTAEEKLANEKSLERLKGEIEGQNIEKRSKGALDVANARGDWAVKAVEKRVQGAIAQARAKAAATPDAKAKAAWNAVVSLGMGGMNVNDYVDFSGDIPVVEYQGYFAPDADDIKNMETIKAAFAKGMNPPEVPAPGATPTATPTVGAKNTTDKWIKDKDGVTVLNPDYVKPK